LLAPPLQVSLSWAQSSVLQERKIKKKINISYSSIIGRLIYVMVYTRRTIAHVVVIRFLSNPKKEHWQTVKWILRYFKGTFRVCLCFISGKPVLNGYTNAYIIGDVFFISNQPLSHYKEITI